MEQLFGAISVVVFIVAAVVVGVRMIRLHRRTGDAPELLLGLMLLLIAGLGYPLTIATQFTSSAVARWLTMISSLCLSTGPALLFLFTWKVFRPSEGWGRLLAFAGVAASIVHVGWRWWTALTQPEFHRQEEWALVLMMLAYLWAGSESLRSYAMMRRRARFGFGDPIVCDRFMLFGLMSLISLAGILLNTVAMSAGVDVMNNTGLQIVSSIIGLMQSALIVLAFAPPRSYLDWVRARPRALAS